MGKGINPLGDVSDPGRKDRMLEFQLLMVDALFEAARAGEGGESFVELLQTCLNWFMAEGRVKEQET